MGIADFTENYFLIDRLLRSPDLDKIAEKLGGKPLEDGGGYDFPLTESMIEFAKQAGIIYVDDSEQGHFYMEVFVFVRFKDIARNKSLLEPIQKSRGYYCCPKCASGNIRSIAAGWTDEDPEGHIDFKCFACSEKWTIHTEELKGLSLSPESPEYPEQCRFFAEYPNLTRYL